MVQHDRLARCGCQAIPPVGIGHAGCADVLADGEVGSWPSSRSASEALRVPELGEAGIEVDVRLAAHATENTSRAARCPLDVDQQVGPAGCLRAGLDS